VRVRGLVRRRAIWLLVLGGMIMAVIAPAASASAALRWQSPRLVDRAAPFSNPAVLNGVSCPSASLCVGVDDLGSIARTTDPEAPHPTWTLTAPIEHNVTFYSISCPSVRLCVAVNQAGGSGERARIAISTDPTGPASTWKVSDANFNSIQNIDCPTTSLCVIDALGGLHVSTNPAAAHPSWKQALPESLGSDDLLSQVSCASAALCVAVGDGGGIYTSTDPARGPSTWQRKAAFPKLLFDDVSCPTTSLCVAFDENGEIVSLSDPTATDAHYVDEGQLPLMSAGVPRGLSCTPSDTCVAVDDAGDAIATTAPNGPASGWTLTPNVEPSGFTTLACGADGFCLAPAMNATVATTRTPAASPPAWAISHPIGGVNALSAISCASVVLCVAASDGGQVVSSRRPGAKSAPWRVAAADPGAAFSSISCPTVRFCAAIGADDRLATSRTPAGGAGAWRPTVLTLTYLDNNGVGEPESFTSISCASASACIAADDWYGLGSSADPGGGASHWSLLSVGEPDYDEFQGVSCPKVSHCVAVGLEGDAWTNSGGVKAVTDRNTLNGISCPSVSFCVAASNGDVLVTDRPSGGRAAWRAIRIDRTFLTSVSCASRSLCAATDSAGRVLVSTDPAGGASRWRATTIDRRYALDGISCPSASLCVAVDSGGHVIVGKR
jgi:hypothetical protein